MAAERALLGAVHDAVAARAELRPDREVTERAVGQGLHVARTSHDT